MFNYCLFALQMECHFQLKKSKLNSPLKWETLNGVIKLNGDKLSGNDSWHSLQRMATHTRTQWAQWQIVWAGDECSEWCARRAAKFSLWYSRERKSKSGVESVESVASMINWPLIGRLSSLIASIRQTSEQVSIPNRRCCLASKRAKRRLSDCNASMAFFVSLSPHFW